MSSAGIEVAHLVFESFGVEPFQRFLDSYRAHPAGIDHELVLAFKGFEDRPEALAACRAMAADVPHRALLVPNAGFDIGSYLHLARLSSADALCFLNSNVELLADDWLAKLHRALVDQGGGVVGATGSWQGIPSDTLRRHFPVDGGAWLWPLRRLVRAARLLRRFPAFPNPHLRTNAFLISRELLLSLDLAEPRTKWDALRIESSRRGFTLQLRRRGLPVRIVDRAGRAWDIPEWNRSGIFFQSAQEHLLIGDNQTRRYAESDAAGRAELYDYAWCPVRRSWFG